MRKLIIWMVIIFTIYHWRADLIDLAKQNTYVERLSQIYNEVVENRLLNNAKGLAEIPKRLLDNNNNDTQIKSDSNSESNQMKNEGKSLFDRIIPPKNEAEGNPNNQDSSELSIEQLEDIPIDMSLLSLLKDNADQVSIGDKITIGTIVLSNFSMDELNIWKSKLADGATEEEKAEFTQLVYDRVSDKEIAQLKEIAANYIAQLSTEEKKQLRTVVEANQ